MGLKNFQAIALRNVGSCLSGAASPVEKKFRPLPSEASADASLGPPHLAKLSELPSS